ncbi:MAG: ABC transporter permease, partial [Longimicrobiales bacterium]
LAAYETSEANLTGDAEPERVPIARATANLFDALGVRAIVGRTFTAEEDVPGRDDVALLGHGLWQRRFGGDRDVIGSSIVVNGSPRTVVGVLSGEFRLPREFGTESAAELIVPLALDLEDLGGPGYHGLDAVARLRPGVMVTQANAELDVVTRRWVAEGITDIERFTAFVRPIREDVLGDVRPALLVLLGAVGFVLLIACTNVANLLLVRADVRQREIAVRSALGAGRGRIVRQLLAESALLAALGGSLGLLVAVAGLEALVTLGPADVPRLDQVRLDRSVLAFTALIALLSGLLFGLVPALRASRGDVIAPLKEGGRSASYVRSSRRLRGTLVMAEVALSVLLLVGAGLLIRSFYELRQLELGFDPGSVLTLQLSLPRVGYPETEDVLAFYDQLVERLEALPGVRSAGAASALPLADETGDWGIDIQGRVEAPDESFAGYIQIVTPGYFETLGVPVVAGRSLNETDRLDGLPVVVISNALAETYWPGENVVGRRMRISQEDEEGPWFTVIGVVGDVRHNAVAEEPPPLMYFPHAQLPLALGGTTAAMALAVSTTAEPLATFPAVREVIRSLDPNLPVSRVRGLSDIVEAAFAEARFITLLLAIFAAVALVLGAVGIYGVIAYMVGQRTQEIGVRIALGAAPGRVVGLVVREGLVLALAGATAGLIVAFGATRILSSLLHGVSATDPPTFLAVALLLAMVSVCASWLPARHAARVDPVQALRSE